MRLAVRCIGHERHGNIVSAGDRIELEIQNAGRAPIDLVLEKCVPSANVQAPGSCLLASLAPRPPKRLVVSVPRDAGSGYYYLTAVSRKNRYSTSFFVNSPGEYSVAVVYPLFTQWAYHADGFYPNHDKLFWEKCAYKLGTTGETLFRLLGVNTTPRFPHHPSISLKSHYRTNRRWQESRDSVCPESHREGLWMDDRFVTVPIVAWLNETGIPYKFFSDLDVRADNDALLSAKVIVFFGQEGLTEENIACIEKIFTRNIPCIFVGMQALGYRQYVYDEETGVLSYRATRGFHGLWGEALEPFDPAWSPEGALFGFQFPAPQTKNWRYDRPLTGWTIIRPESHLFANVQGRSFEYTLLWKSQRIPILTFLGGEYLQRFSPDAEILACLDEDHELIGCGLYGHNIFFAPTYWPYMGFREPGVHPEVFTILNNALQWQLQRSTGEMR